MKIFLDANILFSGSNTQSALHQLLHILGEKHELVTSQYAVIEARRNILRKKSDWSNGFENLVSRLGLCPQSELTVEVELVEKDRPILAAAITGGCAYLVTGDRKDFGHLFGKTIEGVCILTPSSIAEKLV
jgi:predicted nucleic acid-binding protein